MLTLPLWFMTERFITSGEEPLDPDPPTGAFAFTDANKAVAFIDTWQCSYLKMSLATDYDGLILAIADLHREDIETLYLDPESVGSGGKEITLADLLAYAKSLGQKAASG